MRYVVILSTLFSVLLHYNDGYVWEGKRLILPVYHKRPTTVLYSSMNAGAVDDLRQDRFRRGAIQNGVIANVAGGPIPRAFVRGAQLHLKTRELQKHLLSKPKRWAISTLYEAPKFKPVPTHDDKTVVQLYEPENDYIVTEKQQQTKSHEITPVENEHTPLTNDTPESDFKAREYDQKIDENQPNVGPYANPKPENQPKTESYTPVLSDYETQDGLHEQRIADVEPQMRSNEEPHIEVETQTNPYGTSIGEPGLHTRPYNPPTDDKYKESVDFDQNEDDYDDQIVGDENGQSYPSHSASNEEVVVRYPQTVPSGMDGYRLSIEEENMEPMHQVRSSPNPWAARDVYRLGQPRHEPCMLPVDRGAGPDEISAWYYEPKEYRCRWFGYRGHGGNANRFYSRTACESYCIRDMENLCEAVTCHWPGTNCVMVGDDSCKENERRHGRDWRLKCTPDHAVCVSRKNTRMAPDINFQPLPQECLQPKNGGSCERKNPAVNFYYDRERNTCMTFYYHGCGGNDNRFETKSDCMTQCSP